MFYDTSSWNVSYRIFSQTFNLLTYFHSIGHFRYIKFSLIVRPKGHKQKKRINMVISFLLFVSSKPRCHACWILIYRKSAMVQNSSLRQPHKFFNLSFLVCIRFRIILLCSYIIPWLATLLIIHSVIDSE